MSKRCLELRPRDWREQREDRDLSPEHLFKILASIFGKKRAIEKMIDLGIDVSKWINVESENNE